MVGSINFVRKEGDHVKKGDQVSSFESLKKKHFRKIISNSFLTCSLVTFRLVEALLYASSKRLAYNNLQDTFMLLFLYNNYTFTVFFFQSA